MKMLLPELWAFITGRTNHPLYRRELSGWAYLRFWRKLRGGCLPLLAVGTFVVSALCGMLTMLSVGGTSSEGWLIAMSAALVALFFTQGLIHWLLGLLATALTATVISAEVEAETYKLLRVTPLSAREIVLAKFGAAFRQLRDPLLFLVALRLLLVGGTVLTLTLSLTTVEGATPSVVLSDVPSVSPSVVLLLLDVLSVGMVGLLWLLYYLLRPFLSILLFSAVGMLGSSLARTRVGGLLAAGGLRVALGTAGYVLSQVVSTILSLTLGPFLAFNGPPSWLQALLVRPALVVLGGAGVGAVWLFVVMLFQIGLVTLFLHTAIRRAERLPYG